MGCSRETDAFDFAQDDAHLFKGPGTLGIEHLIVVSSASLGPYKTRTVILSLRRIRNSWDAHEKRILRLRSG